jgi:hypothetical protein
MLLFISMGRSYVSELWSLKDILFTTRYYMGKESHSLIMLTEKAEELGGKAVPVPLCPQKNPIWADWGVKPGLRCDRRVSNRPSRT